MGVEANLSSKKGPGIVLQPEEGEGYWQPRTANGHVIVKVSPEVSGSQSASMGMQIIAPGCYVSEHSHTPNEEILFCYSGKGMVIVDGVGHPFVPGTTVYAGPNAKHKIVNDGPEELKMVWVYMPSGLDQYFSSIGRPRRPGEAAPDPFERPGNVSEIEERSGTLRKPVSGSTGRS